MRTALILLAAVTALLAGCAGGPTPAERALREQREAWYRALCGQDPAARYEAVRGLLRQPEEHAQRLRLLVRGPHPGPTRAWAVFLAARHEDAFDASTLLADDDAEVRSRAAEALGLRKAAQDRRIRQALREALADPHPLVRVEAAWAMLRVGKDEQALNVLLASLRRDAPEAAAREAATRLRDLYGPFVAYDPSRGYALRDAAALEWRRLLAEDPRLAGIRPALPPDEEAPAALLEARQLRMRQRAAEEGDPTRQDLVDLWTRALAWRERDACVLAAREEVLAFLVGRMQSEGLLHADFALTLRNQGHLERALHDYAIARRMHPDVSGLLNDEAVCLEALGRLEEASGLLEEAVRKDPADEVPRLNLGRVLLERGLLDEGAASLVGGEARAEGRWPDQRLLLGHLLDRVAPTLSGASPARE